ncbi:unnamed protein product [Bursaphelenchus okinawaensis]|uniref:Peptidase A1 domain-containing protein n=1 Tax=Bursaphelenchus okinawaensis TaxID=465554 RepID=A0A811LN44_9BILA|nr:unnamed protein product [Bursaphelenchus okinawaensis]CAG9124347.1 unnamed protein product [Bursaphelenchus okinawaensis]
MFLYVLLSIIVLNCHAELFRYDGNIPFLQTYFSMSKDEAFGVELSLQNSHYYFLSSECKKCTKSSRTINFSKYKLEKTSDPRFTYPHDKITFSGQNYKSFLGTNMFDGKDGETVPIVDTESKYKYVTSWSGFFGLNFENSWNENWTWKKLFNRISKKKFIVRRGPHYHILNKIEVDSDALHGVLATDVDTVKGCGEFTYYDTIGKGLTLRGSIKIGENLYPNQKIQFSLNSFSKVPKGIYKENYKLLNVEEEDVPPVEVTFGTQKFSVPKENFMFYQGANFDNMLYIPVEESKDDIVTLGYDVLSTTCISFAADGSKMTVGLAAAEVLDDDAKMVPRKTGVVTTTPTTPEPETTIKGAGAFGLSGAVVIFVIVFLLFD